VASNLAQKLIALQSKQKVLNFRKFHAPRFLGCYIGAIDVLAPEEPCVFD
jgi:hypothetical protein